MTTEEIKIPDIGTDGEVEVIEVCVAVGDTIEAEQSLIVLESDKASMEVPSPQAGKVESIALNVGDSVSEGDLILSISLAGESGATEASTVEENQAATEGSGETSTSAVESSQDSKAEVASSSDESGNDEGEGSSQASVTTINVPDIGSDGEVDVIEVCVTAGDEIVEGDSLVVLESDKASMEVPSPQAGKVIKVLINEGDKAAEGTALLELAVLGESASAEPQAAKASPAGNQSSGNHSSDEAAHKAEKAQPSQPNFHHAEAGAGRVFRDSHIASNAHKIKTGDSIYVGPAVRKMAREFGVDLYQVKGTGPKGRIIKEDLQNFVKKALSGESGVVGGMGIPPIPEVNFAKFGPIEVEPMSKIHKVTAENMHRSWLNVPHVTQFDDADITELEDFRKGLKSQAEKRGTKITPLPFLLKACANALLANPKFNASIDSTGENMVYKKYVHIGMAVDTPYGLMVPVIKNVDQKSIWELSEEVIELADKAKDRKLKADEMKGGCFTISSLGGIGGNGFTPIVNAPEVAILGVSKLQVKPIWNGEDFMPRKMLPLSLSYDHRAVNGADAGRFFTYLCELLADIRRIIL